MMNEIWRVLVPEGKVVMIVPNSLSIWARAERTPFGDGKPFSPRQLSELIEESSFNKITIEQALYAPPTENPIMLKMFGLLEDFSRFFPIPFGGVLIAVAEKKVLAPVKLNKKKSKSSQILEPAGVARYSTRSKGMPLLSC